MIATVGLWDVLAAWWQQLADGGRLVLPLRWRGQTRSVALTRHDDTLVSDDMELCGFVPIVGQDGERTTELANGTVRLHHDQDQPVAPDLLAEVFSTPLTEVWSQARVSNEESFDGIWLHATASDNTVCRIEVTKQALEDGVRRPAVPGRSPALVSRSSLAYLIAERDNADVETVTTWCRRLRTRRDHSGTPPDRPHHRLEHRPRGSTPRDHPSGRHPRQRVRKRGTSSTRQTAASCCPSSRRTPNRATRPPSGGHGRNDLVPFERQTINLPSATEDHWPTPPELIR